MGRRRSAPDVGRRGRSGKIFEYGIGEEKEWETWTLWKYFGVDFGFFVVIVVEFRVGID